MRAWTLLVGLGALVAAALVALGALGVAGAQEPAEPGEVELLLSLVDEADAVVPAGSTLRVAAQLRLEPWEEDLSVDAGNLWLLGTSPAQGAQVWEAASGSRLLVGNQQLLAPTAQGEPGAAVTASGLGNGQELRMIAYDGKTAVARARNHRLYVFNTETGTQIANLRSATWRQANNQYCILIDSSCNGDGQSEWGWGRQSDAQLGNAVAVWQESDDRAWLFVGNFRASIRQNAYNYLRSGALWIYEVNYRPATPTVTQRRVIHSWRLEVLSRGIITGDGHGTVDTGHYGTAVAVSADGSTLAVGAPLMHNTGAVYVYSRPAGGWGAALGWNDAVRVSPVVIPAWGHNNSHHPFQPQSTGRTDGRTDCDAYCSAVSSYAADVVDGNNQDGRANFGAHLALSADGSVLAVSAPTKRWASDTPGGSGVFRGTSRAQHGEVLIFTAPAGGWSAVPNYKTGRSHKAWNTNAADFDPALHYGTGPNRRVNEPTWTFSFPWSNQQAYRLGEKLALSPDGTVLAANDRINDAVNLFQVDSPSGWANGPTAPTAQLTGVTDGGLGGEIGFSPNSLTFALGDPGYNSNQGRVLLFQRPVAAANSMRAWDDWANAGAADAEVALAPAARQVSNERYGRTLAWSSGDPDAPLLASLAVGASQGNAQDGAQSGDIGPGRFYTVSREGTLKCPRTERTDAEGTARRTVCTLELGDTRVIIPGGTPDGTFTIEGAVTVGYGDEGRTLTRTARLEVEVGTLREAASAALEFGVDDRGTPSDVRDDRPQRSVLNARGESTLLRLRLLNERDKPSAPGAVGSVVITTTVGSLSTTFGGGCRNGGGHACELDVSALTTSNTGDIPLTLTHAGAGGTASVEALATAKADGRTYESEPLAVVLAGTAASLSIAAPAGPLLNVNTEDGDGLRQPDNRDVLELIVTARDALGHATLTPTRGTSYRITGPDGRAVAAGKIAVQWPLTREHCATGGTNPPITNWLSPTVGQHSGLVYASAKAYIESVSGDGLCVSPGFLVPGATLRAYDAQTDDFALAFENTIFRIDGAPAREFERDDLRSKVRLNVDAAADEPLAPGEYTIELRAGAGGALTARQTFLVSGGAAALTLSEPDGRLAVGERISVTATVADADGNAVADGTPVSWDALDAGAGAVLVQISANPLTTDGMASATWQVVGPGTSTVKATAGDAGAAANARLVTVPAVVAPPPPPVELAPIEYLSSRVPGRLSAWNGEGATRASALLPELEGVSGLLLWRPEGWLRYAVTAAGEVPGSVDFEVARGAVLWLSE